MHTLWNQDQEKDFFTKSLQFAQPEQLFYITHDKKYYAYWPKVYAYEKSTLQSRNSFIGIYTEKYTADLFNELAKEVGGYSVTGVICEEIGLTKTSRADVAICKTKDVVQKPENIMLIFEVKMSIVWNWEYFPKEKPDFQLVCIGDYKIHQGNPSLLRSDTMLKGIGKSINIRVASFVASKIPIIIIGNTPIRSSYKCKVDHLKKNGIVQGFWSINSNPLDNQSTLKNTESNGYYRFDEYIELKQKTLDLLKEDREFFSSMQNKDKLGQIIELANKEISYENKAQKFLELLKITRD